jgi:hypothetical protein
MRKTIFILLSILVLSSCVSADKLSKPRKGVFLFDSNEEVTSIYKSSSLKRLVKKLTTEDKKNGCFYHVLEKKDSSLNVKAFPSEGRETEGWIDIRNTMTQARNRDLFYKLYEKPNQSSKSIQIPYHKGVGFFDVVDLYGMWKKIELKIKGKKVYYWLSEEYQWEHSFFFSNVSPNYQESQKEDYLFPYDANKFMPIYASPRHKEIIFRLKNDSSIDNYYIFNVLEKKDSMLKVEVSSTLDYIQSSFVGWVKITDTGIYGYSRRNYYAFYEAPSYESKRVTIKDEGIKSIFKVVDIKDSWLKVELFYRGEKYHYWLPKSYQYRSLY